MKGAREQAKQEGLKHYFTGLPCKHGPTLANGMMLAEAIRARGEK